VSFISTVKSIQKEIGDVSARAFVLVKTTRFGTYIACTIASEPSEALARIVEGMDTKRYKEIGYDSLLRDTWLIPPPECLTEADLIEVPPGTVYELIQET
jgi:hypothetical protein